MDDESFDPFTLSIPLREGASDGAYARIWFIVEKVKDAFDPDYVVVQCGCDGLAGDPCLRFNWSLAGGQGSMGWCIERIVNHWKGKKLLLGGGLIFKRYPWKRILIHGQEATVLPTLLELGLISHL